MSNMKKLLLTSALALASVAVQARTLVVYYSYTSNVERIVRALCNRIEADVVRVEPAEKGLDYAADNYAIGSAQIAAIRNNPDDPGSYPAIDPVDVDLSRYSTIIIATPLWWSNMASPMQSYLFTHGKEMAGKNIGLIVSSASSGISGVEADAKRLVAEGKFLIPSLWIRSSQTSDADRLLGNWLDEIDYKSLTESGATASQVSIRIGESAILTATLADNQSAQALSHLLESGPVTIDMHDYAGMEKVGSLQESLPRSDTYFTAVPGDLVLYLGNQFVIYYGNNSYNFTLLGKIDGNYTAEHLKAILGEGDVTVTLQSGSSSSVGRILNGIPKNGSVVYDLKGNSVRGFTSDPSDLNPGFYIVDGKKTLVGKR